MKKINFSVSAVNAGQRNVVVNPEVIASSTNGGFRVTPPVSKALGLAHGDYLMFLNNINEIDQAINAQMPELVEFCNENGVELGTSEAYNLIHREFDEWYVAKGIALKNGKGNYLMSNERLTKKDKTTYATQNFDTMMAAAMEQADDEVKDALNREGITKEEQIDILSEFVTPREVVKYQGCKLANPAQLTGIGTSLTGTDSNVWNQLKNDLEDKEAVNRSFAIDITSPEEFEINNGFENVKVTAFLLGAYTDEAPIQRNKKNADAYED